MVSLIGGHYRSNGIKQFPARAVLSINGNGLGGDETHPDTITILRDTRVFPDGEAPPDFNSFEPSDGITWQDYGRYWYSQRTDDGGNFKNAWAKNPADYYQIQNEQGGNSRWAVQRTVDIERAISQAAAEDGVRCCVLNLAGGSPGDFELWREICAPFIVEAWESGGHIYGRHLYGGDLVDAFGQALPGQPMRIFQELDHLKQAGYGGGVVITELGLDSGFGVAGFERFYWQITNFEKLLRPYADMLIGMCWWECGRSEFDADYTDHLKHVVNYMQANSLPKWEPPTVVTEPTEPPAGGQTAVERVRRTGGYMTHLIGTDKRISLRFGSFDRQTFQPMGETVVIPIGDEVRAVQIVSTAVERIEVDVPTTPAPVEPPQPDIEPPPAPSTGALIVDVSHWNDFDLAQLKAAGVAGVIIRSSNGLRANTDSTDGDAIDRKYWRYVSQAWEIGLPFGVYHFLNADYGMVEQVAHYCDIMKRTLAAGYAPSLPLFLDCEDGSPLVESQLKKAFESLIVLNPTAADVGAYTRSYWWNGIVPEAAVWPKNLKLSLWAAAYPSSAPVTGYPPDGWRPFVPNGFERVGYWQWTSQGALIVGLPAGVGIDLSFVGDRVPSTAPPEPPAPQPTVDVLPYLRGADGLHLDIDAGSYTQTLNTQHGADMTWRLVKGGNGQYEYLYADADWIYRREDTSQGNDRFYVHLTNGVQGAGWLPRRVIVGREYQTVKEVTHYLNDCAVRDGLERVSVVDTIRVVALHKKYTFSKTGKTASDVLELYWVEGGETYFFAFGKGLIGFKDTAQDAQFAGELNGRAPLPVKRPHCVDEAERFYV